MKCYLSCTYGDGITHSAIRLGLSWWKLVIKRSADGFLQLRTIYQVDEREH